jgi:NADPH-dependent curcumin reductase CurA
MENKIRRKQNIMAQSTYQSVVLAQRPKGNIVPGETFTLKTNPMIGEKDLGDEQVLVEALYLSLDPAMRGWLNGIHLVPHFSTITITRASRDGIYLDRC